MTGFRCLRNEASSFSAPTRLSLIARSDKREPAMFGEYFGNGNKKALWIRERILYLADRYFREFAKASGATSRITKENNQINEKVS
jgi:hypothetical protein